MATPRLGRPRALGALLGWLLATSSCGLEEVRPGLAPDPETSFATLASDAEFVVGLLGEDWALRAVCPRPAKEVPHGTFVPLSAEFCRGRDLYLYYHPPAGPPTPPVPRTPGYVLEPVRGLRVTVLSASDESEPAGYLEVALSGFLAGEERFGPTGPLRLALRGPYP